MNISLENLSNPSTSKVVILEMDKQPQILSKNDILNAKGVSFGACIIAIVRIGENEYKAMHISPGSIITECISLITDSLDSEIAIYQSDITGEISEVYLNGNKFNKKSLKSAFKSRDLAYKR